MRVVIQRVSHAEVIIDKKVFSEINTGILIFLGIEEIDTLDDINWLCSKISKLRIFPDNKGVMNLDVREVCGEIIVVSQFTLHASTKKGNRPSYIRSARPETAIPLYNKFISILSLESGSPVKTGKFGANMLVNLSNDGPVTILIDSKNRE